jgi:hypothetical protein
MCTVRQGESEGKREEKMQGFGCNNTRSKRGDDENAIEEVITKRAKM